jgi:hypothetical protein
MSNLGGYMLRKLLFVLFVLPFSILTFALDDQGNPNDPSVNDRANACYEDGAMAGKCDTEWEWICGWFMIRFDYGIFSREDIPASCASLLPQLPEDEESRAPVNCEYTGTAFVNFGSGNYVPTGTPYYSDINCTQLNGISTAFGYAFTLAGQAAADQICAVNEPGHIAYPDFNNYGVYRCAP